MRAVEALMVRAARVVAAVVLAARAAVAQQDIPGDKAATANAVRVDLTKLTDLERAWFATHKRFTDDIKALNFVPTSGAVIAVTYASARAFSASASHARLAPFVCFSIVSTPNADTPADKPFCTDSRYGNAAASLARSSIEPDTTPTLSTPAITSPPPRREENPSSSSSVAGVMPITHSATPPVVLTVSQFAERIRRAAIEPTDSIVVVVQFAVKDARYDASRGVLEVAIEPVLWAAESPAQALSGDARVAPECSTRPAFLCSESGLSYIARGIWHVPAAKLPTGDLRAGLGVQAMFQIGHHAGTRRSTLALLALVLQSSGTEVSRWEPTPGR